MSREKDDEIIREEAIAWLAKIRGGISPADERAFEQWYASDIRHADLYDAMLNAWEAGEPKRLYRAQSSSPAKRSWIRFALAAAAVVLLLLVGTVAVRGGIDPTHSTPTRLASKPGEVRSVALADGSRVMLDGNAAVNVDFSASGRILNLQQGRARFEVAKDGRSFTVRAGKSEVVALGTVFDVQHRGRETVIWLIEGEVEVRSVNAGTSAVKLGIGERLSIADGASEATPTVEVADARDWPSVILSFQNVKVEEVVAAANRHSEVGIVVADRAIRDQRFTGTINTGDQKALANAIAEAFGGATAQNDAGTIVIRLRR